MKSEELLARRMATARRIVDLAEDIGKTKIQKIAYFLQESIGVPLKLRFRMHYYGPYSEELDSVLSLAQSLGYIDIRPDLKGFGYHVTPVENSLRFRPQEYDISKEPLIDEIDGVISILAGLETVQLELYATIHFISGPESKLTKGQTLETVKRLKPKFSLSQIEQAYQTLKNANLIERSNVT